MTCLQLYQELQKCRSRRTPKTKSVAGHTAGQKAILFSQINNTVMVGTEVEETMIKSQAAIAYKFMIGQILLISNDHTTPYTESQKKIWDILLSLELASQNLTSHTIKQVANFLYRINPPKARHPQQFPHSASPFWNTFSEQIPHNRSEGSEDKSPKEDPLPGLWVCHTTLNIKVETVFYETSLVHHRKYYQTHCV